MISKMSEGSLSQDEINALLNQLEMEEEPGLAIEDFLSPMEQDALGEIGNISLGSSTTALSTLLNQRVEITTPVLSVIEEERMKDSITENLVSVNVDYTSGIRGRNLLMIKENDAKIIANLMMGGDGTNVEPELTEMHLSAVQEAMNQMMGSAATSMSTLFQDKVDISPPEIGLLGVPPTNLQELEEEIIIVVSFNLKVGDLIDSNMIQYIPLSFGKEMIHRLLGTGESQPAENVAPPAVESEPVQAVQQEAMPQTHKPNSVPSTEDRQQKQMNIQKVEYHPLPESATATGGASNLDLLYDIPLEITVELGRTKLPIRKILELGPGAVIQLEKLAGEPVDILANHRLIARGEVVVIEENFGVRITDIVNPAERLNTMTSN